jgi:antitoxin ParD1/3/4
MVMPTETFHISLPDTLSRYVEERVREGQYGDTGEFIRELIQKDRDEQLQEQRNSLEQELMTAADSLDRGEGADVTPEYWQELRHRARAQLTEGNSTTIPPPQ